MTNLCLLHPYAQQRSRPSLYIPENLLINFRIFLLEYPTYHAVLYMYRGRLFLLFPLNQDVHKLFQFLDFLLLRPVQLFHTHFDVWKQLYHTYHQYMLWCNQQYRHLILPSAQRHYFYHLCSHRRFVLQMDVRHH